MGRPCLDRPPIDLSSGTYAGASQIGNTATRGAICLLAMNSPKKPIPPVDVINEDSGPPVTDIQKPKTNPEGDGVEIDDAQIEKPKDDAFKKAPAKGQPPSQHRKGA